MKRNTALMLALCLLVIAASAPDAQAGRKRDAKKLSRDHVDMPADYGGVHRVEPATTMQFHTGVLRRDGLSGWMVDDYALQMSSESVVLDSDGQSTVLQEGSRVLVMGPRFGNTFVGWNVRLLGPEMSSSGMNRDVVKKPSDVTADVGELISSPR